MIDCTYEGAGDKGSSRPSTFSFASRLAAWNCSILIHRFRHSVAAKEILEFCHQTTFVQASLPLQGTLVPGKCEFVGSSSNHSDPRSPICRFRMIWYFDPNPQKRILGAARLLLRHGQHGVLEVSWRRRHHARSIPAQGSPPKRWPRWRARNSNPSTTLDSESESWRRIPGLGDRSVWCRLPRLGRTPLAMG